MKTPTPLLSPLLAVLLAVLLVACGDDAPPSSADAGDDASEAADEGEDGDAYEGEEDAAGPAVAGAEREPPPGTPRLPPLLDADALALLGTIDAAQVAAAKLAESNGETKSVKDFAAMLATEHAASAKQVSTLARTAGPIGNHDRLQSLKSAGDRDVEDLQALQGVAFDVAYLESVVRTHAEALALIDDKLLPAARIDAVREHLDKSRAAIAEHHTRAEALLLEL